MIMGWCGCIAPSLSKMQDHQLLTVDWRWFLEGGTNIINSIFANKGGQCSDCSLTVLYSPQIIQDAWPKMIDAPLNHFNEILATSSLVVLATVQGYPAVVRGGTDPEALVRISNGQRTRTRWLAPDCYMDRT